jgi:hypothetical protein
VTKERWLPVPNFPDYEVSSLGRVRSKDRVVTRRDGVRVSKKGVLLKPGLASNGYLTVCLGRGNSFCVHALVALAFLGEAAGRDVCHKDGCRTNNALKNLRYGTRSENIADAKKHGTWWTPERYGSHRPRDENGRYLPCGS